MNLIVYNACKAMKLLIITWVHICISFNKLIWLMQKNEKIDILSLIFMPFTGNKSPGAKKCSDEWWCDNFSNIFWVKRTFMKWLCSQEEQSTKQQKKSLGKSYVQRCRAEYNMALERKYIHTWPWLFLIHLVSFIIWYQT